MIDRFVEKIPESLKRKSGSVFYSGRTSFSSPSDLYILGTNPGGSPTNAPEYLISKNIDDVLHRKPLDWFDYKDGCWGDRPPGEHYLQKNMLHLLKQANKNVREVPASEVVFLRSKDVRELESCYGKSYKEVADECWPFHEAVINELGIRVIVVYGTRSGRYVRSKLKAIEKVKEIAVPHGTKRIHVDRASAWRNAEGITVVNLWFPGVGHPWWTKPVNDPTGLVVNALKEASAT